MTATHVMFHSGEIIYGTGETLEAARAAAQESCAADGTDITDLDVHPCTQALHDLVGREWCLTNWQLVDGVGCTNEMLEGE